MTEPCLNKFKVAITVQCNSHHMRYERKHNQADKDNRMATIAAGIELGIAPKANLCLVKTKNRIKNKYRPELSFTLPITLKGLVWFVNAVLEDIEERRSRNPGTKSVINMSWGKCSNFILLSAQVLDSSLWQAYKHVANQQEIWRR